MKAYDPFPRSPSTAARVRVRDGRAVRPSSFGVINMPNADAPRVKHVGRGKKRIKRWNFK